MLIDSRLSSCIDAVTGLRINEEDFSKPLKDFGVDSIEMMDLLYQIEKEFNVKNFSNSSLLQVKNLSVSDIKRQLVQHVSNTQV